MDMIVLIGDADDYDSTTAPPGDSEPEPETEQDEREGFVVGKGIIGMTLL